ncbi:uncharacterized protein LOC115730515 isoform X2 [Rhodamnia argentea]|uniref:Uncharacterized protein LOC115730515 isoform X2 n=1 Tax=Rhodamnia argentea TaxID=178133 RepID=A0A8B8N3Q4_9MYRT|nr:uncharacterized protein LOC115730515 isoform X2 [Rhodamnia argentea]
MAGPTHINQHGVRGETKVQNAHHEIFKDFPSQFAKQQIQENEEMATLRFSDRSWPVKLLSYMHEIRVFFASGWPVFAELIGVWEISVFELIDTSPFSLMPVGSNHLHEEQAILSWIFMVLHFQGLSHLP